jgi:excinuclease ABC subunit B
LAYNKKHKITPASIQKAIRRGIEEEVQARQLVQKTSGTDTEDDFVSQELLKDLESQMLEAAHALEFEQAAEIRDRIQALKDGHPARGTTPSSSRSPR